MGRKKGEMKKENDGEEAGNDGDAKKRKQQYKWEQDDTERLCELLLEHGKSGILNKVTNAAVNEKKKQEWETIAMLFNSSPKVYFLPCLFCVWLTHSLSFCSESFQPRCHRTQ